MLKIKRVNIRTRLVGLMVLLAFVPLLVILLITLRSTSQVEKQVAAGLDSLGNDNLAQMSKDVYALCSTAHQLVTQQVEHDLNVAKDLLRRNPMRFTDETLRWTAVNQFNKQQATVTLPQVTLGGATVGQNRSFNARSPLVDEVAALTGATCTIFQRMNGQGDMLRVATSVRGDDGNRAIGTYIPAVNPDGTANPVIQSVMRGQTFHGRAYVVNAWYITAYEPIRDASGEIVGVIYVGVKQEAVESLRQAIYDMKVGQTGYVFVLGGKGDQRGRYIISLNGTRDGEDIWEARDSNGRLFIQDMINNGVALKPGEVYMISYPWKNVGEKEARYKKAAITYFEPWDWVIGPSTYEEEYRVAHQKASASFDRLLFSILLFSLVMVAVASFAAFYFGNGIARPLIELTRISKRIAKGDLTESPKVRRKDELGELADATRDMLKSLNEKAEVAEQISRGNLDVEVHLASENDSLGRSMQRMKESVHKVIADLDGLAEEHRAGDVEARCDLTRHTGGYASMLENVNGAFEAIAAPVIESIGILNQYASGNLESVMRDLPGKQQILPDSLNRIRSAVRGVISETVDLVEAARNGNLKDRGNVEMFEGAYRQIIEGINGTLDAILDPINKAAQVLEHMAEGDLSIRVEGDYKGDHALIKDHLNQTLEALNRLIAQTTMAVNQVADGSAQVSQSSQSLSQGATEQASALEEISASMTEIGSQTRLNADNAAQANKLAVTSRTSAHQGNEQMERMVRAMAEISDSSSQVQKIIKAIDEIAFQTNLLALNAAVEAARAGAHGKGFAVVAEEVRNLAQRSAKAAQETTTLIEGSVEKTRNGEEIASETASSLGSIVESITKVSDLIGEIDSASREQAQAIDQVAHALDQVDQVTQANTSTAEESAATAEELSGQAAQLKVMLSRFVLDDSARQEMANTGLALLARPEEGRRRGHSSGPAKKLPGKGKEVHPSEVISLDDTDFGGF